MSERRFMMRKRSPPPQSEWNELRLLKANRNYAVEYIRNGIAALIEVVGEARAEALAARRLGSLTATLLGDGSRDRCSRWRC